MLTSIASRSSSLTSSSRAVIESSLLSRLGPSGISHGGSACARVERCKEIQLASWNGCPQLQINARYEIRSAFSWAVARRVLQVVEPGEICVSRTRLLHGVVEVEWIVTVPRSRLSETHQCRLP